MICYWYFAFNGMIHIKTHLDASKVLPRDSIVRQTNMILDEYSNYLFVFFVFIIIHILFFLIYIFIVLKEYYPVTVLINKQFNLENITQVEKFYEMVNEFENLTKCKGKIFFYSFVIFK